ncbi:MAG: Pseudouridine synthase, partial [Candidatus Peribacteria bacterium]|nr:Pseudouridine synthase [Candidatus Peribacteria bacterium]
LHAIGHPILGDPSYFTAQSQKIAAKLDIHNVCLHSRQIQFNSPADGKTYTVTAPIAADFMKVLKNIGMDESV